MQKDQWDAKEYARYSQGQAKWADELINTLQIKGNEKILDIGCGDGRHSYTISKKFPNTFVTAIDKSEKMIKVAKKEYKRENLEYIVMDASNLKLNNNYDIVFSNAVLHWVQDHLCILKNLKSFLNPDAKILFSMGGKGNAIDILSCVDDTISSKRYKEYFKGFKFPYYFYDINEYREFLKESGYKEKRIELIKKDMIHKDLNALKGWIRTTWFPYTNMLPINKREVFIDELAKNYILKYIQNSNKNICIKMVRLEVEASL